MISVSANIVPEKVAQMVAMYMAGDVKGCRNMQFFLNPLNKVLFCEVNPIPVKTAMKLMGMDVGPLRLPLTEMEGANLERLRSVLAEYDLI